MSRACALERILMSLSILFIASGVIAAIADPGWSAPKIEIITYGPGQRVTFRIYFYLFEYQGTWNSWTIEGPSPLNDELWKIQLGRPGLAPAIRVWDPDGVEYQWVGPPVPIIVQPSGVDPQHPGADESYYLEIVFDPNDQDGWDRVPNTGKTGLYMVDFDGYIFLSTGGEQPFSWRQYFDIAHTFYMPEMSAASVALLLSGLAMLVLRKRLVK
jgi:hypothetical protein